MDLLQVCRRAVLTTTTTTTRPTLLLSSQLTRALSATSTNLISKKSPSSSGPRRPPTPTPIEKIRTLLRRSDKVNNNNNNDLPPRPPSETLASLPAEIRADADRSLKLFDTSEFEVAQDLHPKEPTLRLRPVTGRTVNVGQWSNPAKALQQLTQLTKRNAVSREFMLQRFHERPALKRKRQQRERWRKRFSEGIRTAISRTLQLKSQGW